jgi:hypothetical protein
MPEDDKDSVNSSLEESSTEVSTDNANSLESGVEDAAANQAKEDEARLTQKKSFGDRMLAMSKGTNLYLLGFGVILVIAGLVTFIAITSDDTKEGGLSIDGGELTQEAIDELLKTDTNIGDVKETLTVEANAIFNGKVLVKDSLDIAGALNVGGTLSLTGLAVSGQTTLQDAGLSGSLSVGGNANISGTTAIESNLTVAGDVSVGGTLSAGSLNVQSIQFTNDLQVLRHIDTGGSTPTAARGSAIGGAGSVSISGTDVAGTITINTSGGVTAGAMANITFANAYGRTPHVIISPVGSTSAVLNYYATRTSTGFSIASANSPSASTTYIFDYWVAE